MLFQKHKIPLFLHQLNILVFIKYDNLVLNTKEEINKIYEFLDIPSYKHSYHNLKQFECNSIKYNDDILGANLHHVKSEITKSDYDFMDYVVGFVSGNLAILSGLSGVLITIWCSFYNWSKLEYRATVQAFNVIILGMAFILMLFQGALNKNFYLFSLKTFQLFGLYFQPYQLLP